MSEIEANEVDPVKAVKIDLVDNTDTWLVEARVPAQGPGSRAVLQYLILSLADVFEQTPEGEALFACFKALDKPTP